MTKQITVRMTVDYGVSADGSVWLAKGQEYTLDEELALTVLAWNRATAVEEEVKNTSLLPAIETASLVPATRKRAAKKVAPKD